MGGGTMLVYFDDPLTSNKIDARRARLQKRLTYLQKLFEKNASSEAENEIWKGSSDAIAAYRTQHKEKLGDEIGHVKMALDSLL
jgi:hypothetical protein